VETQVRTPQSVFMLPQRFAVPLFQRPYVWARESQWEPLWNDLVRVAQRMVDEPHARHQPHFLGAVVLQQTQNPVGKLQERTIIDGQQRLTTLQLLFDALHAELLAVGSSAPALRLEPLVTNAEPFCERPEDRFKVWPTNRDRPAFNAVMGAAPPVEHDALGFAGEKMLEAHRFFSESARDWLDRDAPGLDVRANAIETASRELLQLVVIDLAVDENAQEIFETLNARGAPLTAADLIKNFVFQRLLESGADVEHAYDEYWRRFESAFWETEINVGRTLQSRSSVFMNHWLIARTGEEIVAREVFARFKSYVDFDADLKMAELLVQIDRAADIYRRFIEDGSPSASTHDRLGLFAYRTSAMESEVVKPLVLFLLDPELPAVPADQLDAALGSIESWMVRRMLVRATTKAYNQVLSDLVVHLRSGSRDEIGDRTRAYLAAQQGESRYWPDDDDVSAELETLPAYRRLSRARLRMVLEAVEDHLRGWHGNVDGLASERVPRGKLHIEHVMPQKWIANWSLPPNRTEHERNQLIHTIGNLTLLTGRLNSKVSNGPWVGPSGKQEALTAHDVLLLNRDLIQAAAGSWTDQAIRGRSAALAKLIIDIWPVPEGHKSPVFREKAAPRTKVELSDLIAAGRLTAGMSLVPRRKVYANRVAVLLPDGRIDIDGSIYSTPSEAAVAVTKKPTNGWWFFLVDAEARRSLREVRRDYLEAFAEGADEDDIDDVDGDDDD